MDAANYGAALERDARFAFLERLAKECKAMRDAQRAYFTGRSPESLSYSRKIEKQVDEILFELADGGQKRMF